MKTFPSRAGLWLALALGASGCGHDHGDHDHGDGAVPDRPDGAFLCLDLGPLCHDVDNGDPAIAECHEQGHIGEAAWCAANLSRCVALCTAANARADASTPTDSAHTPADSAHTDTGPSPGDAGVNCQALGNLCHDVDPGSGPLHDCHEGAHDATPAWCAANAQQCFDLCTAARADAGRR